MTITRIGLIGDLWVNLSFLTDPKNPVPDSEQNLIKSRFLYKLLQEMVERILYIWAIRHPASGYVQGINDLVTPFLMVFLQDFVDKDVTKSSFVFEVELAMGLIFSLLEMGI